MQALSTVVAPDTLLTLATPEGPSGNGCLPPQFPAPGGETPGTTSNAGGRVLRSSWIQRLKPGEEVEPIRGSSTESLPDLTLLGGRTASYVTGAAAQAPMQIVHERTDGLAETQHNNRIFPGFGPWIHLRSANCSEGKLHEEPHRAQSNSVDALIGAVTTYRPTEMEERARLAVPALAAWNGPCRFGERQSEFVSLINTAKPPLPPQSKPSSIAKPVNQKDQSSTFTGNPIVVPPNKVGVCKRLASAQNSLFSLAASPHLSDGRLMHCSNDGAGTSSMGIRPSRAGLSNTTRLMHGGILNLSGAVEITGQAPREALLTGIQSVHLSAEDAEQITFVNGETALQTAANELDTQQSLTENFCKTMREEEAQGSGVSTSTTASFPWEVCIETAGASKKAREQFVEVYNKARDELKRTSHGHSRGPERTMVESSRMRLGKAVNGSTVVGGGTEKMSLESGPVQAEGLNLGLQRIVKLSGLITNNINEHNKREQIANKQIATGFVKNPSNDSHVAGGGTSHGKRPRAMFETADSSSIQVGRVIVTPHEKLPSRSDLWLQRWHPALQISNGMQGSEHLPSNKVGRELNRVNLPLGMNKSEKSPVHCEFAPKVKRTWLGNISFSNLDGCEHSNMHSSKGFPSAAAMAIVGTAARQFCLTQPQRKGSFAFWSGFGMYTDQNLPQVLKDKGKGSTA